MPEPRYARSATFLDLEPRAIPQAFSASRGARICASTQAIALALTTRRTVEAGVNTWAGKAPPPSERDARLLEWRMVLPSVDDARVVAERLASAGHSVSRESEGWLATDPWGTPLRLMGS